MSIIANSHPIVNHEFSHDFRPTHNPRPDWVTDAQATARIAWTQHDEAVEAYLAGRIGFDALSGAERQAQAAQQYAEDMLGYWLAGYEPVSVQAGVEIDITVSI